MSDCIFCKIAHEELSADIVYENDFVIAFRDIHPQQPVHILVIPKKHVANFMVLEDDDVWNHLRKGIKHIVHSHELEGHGYKIEINGGSLQDVQHLHVHVKGPYK